jgi:translation initiation factor 1
MAGLFDGTSLERPVTCEACGLAMDVCRCPRDGAGRVARPKDQSPRVRRERRRGKWNTIVAGLDPDATDLKALLKHLKGTLGTGGGVDTDAVELVIQGDHRDAVVERLRGLGYKAKASGG